MAGLFRRYAPVTDPRFHTPDTPEPSFLLANHAQLPPPRPLLEFDVNACAVKFAVVPDSIPRFVDFGEFEIAPDKGLAVRPGSATVWKLPTHFLEA